MTAAAQQNVRTALLLALSGFATLSIGDAVVKTMAGQWPAPAVAMLRYSAAALALALLVLIVEGRKAFRMPRPWLQLCRGAGVSVATICFFLAVMAMPLADATAIQFTSPIITAMLAPLFLKERTSAAVWLAMALAFAGVLVVLRPNVLALGGAALYPVGAAAGMACLMICNRKAAGLASPLAMQFYAALMAAPILIAASLLLAATGPQQFQIGTPPASVVIKSLIVACTATAGHMLIYMAAVRASAALVAPMTYVQLLVAAALSWAIFGTVPDWSTYAGAALIIGGGLLLWRAHRPIVVPEAE